GIEQKFNRTMWKEILINALSGVNNCVSIGVKANARWKIPGKHTIYGKQSNVDAVKYLYMLFTREIERLATLYGVHTGYTGLSQQTSFKSGASVEICERLRDAKRAADIKIQESGQHGNAFVHISNEKDEVEKLVREKHP